MAYGIFRAHKLGKQKRKRLDNTTYTYSAPSTPSYSYKKLNENTDSNINFVIPQHFDNYIQTQRNSASDVSTGENDVAPSRLYQSTNHHGNTD